MCTSPHPGQRNTEVQQALLDAAHSLDGMRVALSPSWACLSQLREQRAEEQQSPVATQPVSAHQNATEGVSIPAWLRVCSTCGPSSLQTLVVMHVIGEKGIGVREARSTGVWAPRRRTYSGSSGPRRPGLTTLQGHPLATSDPQRDIVSTTSIRPTGLTISGAAKDGERVCFVAPRSLLHLPIRAFPPGSSPAPTALPYQY